MPEATKKYLWFEVTVDPCGQNIDATITAIENGIKGLDLDHDGVVVEGARFVNNVTGSHL
jgi:hypothetical protein